MLIGLDQADFMTSDEEVKSDVGDPVSRKIPLGWTCIRHPDKSEANANFTFFYKEDREHWQS